MYIFRFLLAFIFMSSSMEAQTGNLSNKDSIEFVNKLTKIYFDESITYLSRINEIEKLANKIKLKDNEYLVYISTQAIAITYYLNKDYEKAYDCFDLTIFFINKKYPNLILKAMLNCMVTAYKLRSNELLIHALYRYTSYCFEINNDRDQICYVLKHFQLYKEQGYLEDSSDSKINSLMLENDCNFGTNLNNVKPDTLFIETIFN